MCRLVNSQYQANGNTIVELVLKYIKQNYTQYYLFLLQR